MRRQVIGSLGRARDKHVTHHNKVFNEPSIKETCGVCVTFKPSRTKQCTLQTTKRIDFYRNSV